jgi:YVTN family beta-propeller protein
VAFRPDGTTAYVTNVSSDTVSVIDVASGAVTGTIAVGDGPWGVAVTPAGTLAYVTNTLADTVSVIDVASGTVTGTIAVGDGPYGVAFRPDGTTAYVANTLADTVSVITRSGKRVFIGGAGQDQGFNPPFGVTRAGALMSWGRERRPPWVAGTAVPLLKACLMVDTPTASRTSLTMELQGGVLATAVLKAASITMLWLDQGPGQTPKKLIGTGGVFPPPVNGYTHVLASFDMETGELFAVTPTKSRSTRAGEEPYRIEEQGGCVTLHGDLAGVYDVRANANVAPDGASAVMIEAGTGRVVAVEGN